MGAQQGFRPREVSARPQLSASHHPPHTPCAFQLAELIHTPPCLMTLAPAADEPKQEAPKEEKPPPWAPPPQNNFMKNWQRNLALWKRQQEALSSEQRGWAPAWRPPPCPQHPALLLGVLSPCACPVRDSG